MKAILNDQVIAEADKDVLIFMEGNWYFPPSSTKNVLYEKSPTPYTCPWKGACQYWNVNGAHDAAWSYPDLVEGAVERVGADFAGYFAFDPAQVQVS
jgi:uncharacterized protein (DUF427 family)